MPAVSERQDTDLVTHFLLHAERTDKRAAQVDVPAIHELIPERDPHVVVEAVLVGLAMSKEALLPRSARRRRKLNGTFPPSGLTEEKAISGRSRPTNAVKCQRSNRCQFDVVLINSSGKPQLLAAVGQSLGATILVNQEHHCSGPAMTDLQHDAKHSGWTLVGAAAHRTVRDGAFVGTAVVAKAGVTLGDVAGKFDHSPATSPGRLTAAWVQAGSLPRAW